MFRRSTSLVPPSSQSLTVKEFCFMAPDLSPIFREISRGHLSWKLKDEHRRSFSSNFRHVFSPMSAKKNSPEFRSRGFSAY